MGGRRLRCRVSTGSDEEQQEERVCAADVTALPEPMRCVLHPIPSCIGNSTGRVVLACEGETVSN